ncbi:hypothetical protein TNIN_301201 [Trichonephila inaurata madagascariensis]|uniref:Uncharacterized protein n=1 Tax=Trichonephila inaurata madagascariensis TaxID=2747483 RepID=A0A8X7C6T1_9ARAC|nr:hypothetical protein TNIN_301201 [Trichonephila inaurata madagascariensis]
MMANYYADATKEYDRRPPPLFTIGIPSHLFGLVTPFPLVHLHSSQHARFRGFTSFVYVMKRVPLPGIPPSFRRWPEGSALQMNTGEISALIKTFVASRTSQTNLSFHPRPSLPFSFCQPLSAAELKSLVIH